MRPLLQKCGSASVHNKRRPVGLAAVSELTVTAFPFDVSRSLGGIKLLIGSGEVQVHHSRLDTTNVQQQYRVNLQLIMFYLFIVSIDPQLDINMNRDLTKKKLNFQPNPLWRWITTRGHRYFIVTPYKYSIPIITDKLDMFWRQTC